MQSSGLATAAFSLFFVAATPALAGPCTDDINRLQKQVQLSTSQPVVAPTATQTVGAQLHRQPTPDAVEHAETKANADADAAMDRARKADEKGDTNGCQEALRQARLLYGLTKN